MMIEPTESESLAELDRFCDTLIKIKLEIDKIKSGKYDKDDNPVKCGSRPLPKTEKIPAEKSGVICLGENELLIRKRKRDQNKFLGCSKFPKCKVALPIKPVDDKDIKKWELQKNQIMEKCVDK